jgi:hypothetical protein
MYLKYLSNIFVKVVRSMDNNTRTKDNEENEEGNYKYKCEECGINFGNSIGDMELHKLTVHLQKGDTELK